MADLTIPKKRQIERLLQMDDGYVLNFWCLRVMSKNTNSRLPVGHAGSNQGWRRPTMSRAGSASS